MSVEDGVLDDVGVQQMEQRLRDGTAELPEWLGALGPNTTPRLLARFDCRGNWRTYLLGDPNARLFIHHDHLATLHPDGRLRIRGPR